MDLHLVNRKLKDLYGQDLLSQAIYHVVWSDDEIEKRFSYFEDYIPGTNILIRKVQEVREVKKYNFLKSQYILEKLFVNKHNTEILDNTTLSPRACTYEPLWAFGFDKQGKPLRPIWRAIEIIIDSAMNPPRKLTPSEINDKEFEKMRKDEELMMELMNTHIKSDTFHSSVQDGDTVLLNQDYKNGNR